MHDTSIWMSLTPFGPISQPPLFTGWRGTGRTYWRMVQMSKHGDSWAGNGDSYTHTCKHTHIHTNSNLICPFLFLPHTYTYTHKLAVTHSEEGSVSRVLCWVREYPNHISVTTEFVKEALIHTGYWSSLYDPAKLLLISCTCPSYCVTCRHTELNPLF